MRGGSGFSAGVAAAVEDAGDPDVLAPLEQLDLLGDVGLPLAEYRRRGRPGGARNKRTGEVRTWLLRSYTHPLEVLAATASMDTGRLAVELGISKADAHAMRIKAAVELAPYLEGKMPVSVDLTVRSDISLIIPGVNAPLGTVEDIAKLLTLDTEQFQEVSA
jgi:hypothetical protein